MLIAFVLTQSLESPSGLGRYWPLAKELAKQGHEVHIIALHHHLDSLNERDWTESGVHIHYVAQMHIKKIGHEKFYFKPATLIWIVLMATLKLTLALFKIKPDVVHLAKPHPMNGIATWLFSIIKNVPLYVDCDDYEAASNRFGGSWQRKIVAWFEDHLPLQAKAVTVNTHFTRERLIKLGCLPERIFYVPNGVDRARFSAIDQSKLNTLKDKFDLHEKKVILYLGSLSLISHNVDLLVRAFAQVAPRFEEVVLMLVGGGEDREALIALANQLGLGDKVIHVGKVEPSDAPYYYHLAYLSVDPVTNSEANQGRSPLKIFESLACGVPVVTGDVGDRRKILDNGNYGMLVVPDSVAALSAGLEKILTDQHFSQRLRYSIQTDYAQLILFWDQLVNDFIEVYQE